MFSEWLPTVLVMLGHMLRRRCAQGIFIGSRQEQYYIQPPKADLEKKGESDIHIVWPRYTKNCFAKHCVSSGDV